MGRGPAPEHLGLHTAHALTTAQRCQSGPGSVYPPTTFSCLPGFGSISSSQSGAAVGAAKDLGAMGPVLLQLIPLLGAQATKIFSLPGSPAQLVLLWPP